MKDLTCISDVMDDQYPDTDDRHLGIEIEFCHKMSMTDLAHHLLDMWWGPYITLKQDSSVDGPNGWGYEFAILVPEEKYRVVLTAVLDWLYVVGAWTNKTCGLHVHLDMRTRNAEECFKALKEAQPLLYKLCAPSRRENTYCRPLPLHYNYNMILESVCDRYFGINALSMEAHTTIEVRMHEGTLDPARILPWIGLLIHLVDTQPVVSACTLRDVIRTTPMPPPLLEYVRRRWKRRRLVQEVLYA